MRRAAALLRRERLGVLLLCGLASSVLELAACGEEAPPPGYAPGRWRTFRTHRYDRDLDPAQREMVERLEAIGYVAGKAPPPNAAGVVALDPERVSPGATLYTSGHGPEAILIDLSGREIHRWRADFWEVWPDYPVDRWHADTSYWRRAHLFPNGDLLAIFEGLGLIKVDRDSKLLWAQPLRVHHDLEIAPDGGIYALTREAHLVPDVDPDQPILEDFVSRLDAEGRELSRVSLLRAFLDSDYRDLLPPTLAGDVFHTNSIRLLDGRLADRVPAFRAGNVLVSLLVPNVVAVVDLEAERVVWAARGSWRKQHDAKILDSGRMLIFDNGEGEASAVLELDVLRESVTWAYRGSAEKPFYSETCGTAQRLPNGNTLIAESDNGRAFEVTAEGDIVWEFYNPHHAGPYIGTLFEAQRLAPAFPLGWARGPSASGPPRPDAPS